MGFRETTLQTEDPAYGKVLGLKTNLECSRSFQGHQQGKKEVANGFERKEGCNTEC